jgi:predicted metalloendopeptidase
MTKVDSVIGDILGKHFMDAAFDANNGKSANEMVSLLEASFNTGLENATWLDETTRQNAKTKLSKFTHLIGGPSNPKMYPTISFSASTYFENVANVNTVDLEDNLKLIGTRVIKKQWSMSAPTVNAYYSPRANQIVFPAGILQSPFFNAEFDASQNFGAIGMVIGHEITHGFDNKGRNFDGDGNLSPWWSPTVKDAFEKKAQCIIDQYSGFQVRSDLNASNVLGNVDGELTLGETIADNGGLKSSFRAWTEYAKTHDSKYTKETAEKLFFLSFAQCWCSKVTDARQQDQLRNVHPPGRFRVLGAVQNNIDFARVFNCPVNAPMNPAHKCFLWE